MQIALPVWRMNRAVISGVLVAVAFAVCAIVTPATAAADRYYAAPYYPRGNTVVIFPKNAYVGAGLIGTRILQQRGGEALLDDGAGFTLFAGIRLNKQLALEAGWSATLHNPTTTNTPFGSNTDYLVLHGLTADAKLYLSETSAKTMEPYLQGGVGVYLLDGEYFGTESVGTGFQLGGGIDFMASRKLRLGLRALYRGMSMGPPNSSQTDTFISAATVEANLLVRF